MEYSKEFKKLVDNCLKSGFHIGGGNPNAKILFVGQEAAIEKRESWYNDNAKIWKKHIDNNSCDSFTDTIHENHVLRKGWGKNTWSKYQKLHDYIFEKKSVPFEVDFLKKVFTTEMSDNPAKTNGLASKNPNFKSDLQNRKEAFFNEDFIQNFNVVVLACSKYIVNNKNNWEINNLFKVEYVGDNFKTIDGLNGTKYYSPGNWYFLHLDNDKTKLVIHTRQLSSNVNEELLKDLGKL